MEREDDSHARLDDIKPGIVEGEICDEDVDENLDFDDRESHPKTGLRGHGIGCTASKGRTDTTHPGSDGERHQVRVETWLSLRSIWEVFPTVWPVRQNNFSELLGSDKEDRT